VTGEASLEARIENDDVRSLDLTIPHRNPAFLVHFAGPRSGCSIECRSSRKRGPLLHAEKHCLAPRAPLGIAIIAIFAAFGFDFYRCFFIRLVRIAPCVPF
jgi:hypothetical protein